MHRVFTITKILSPGQAEEQITLAENLLSRMDYNDKNSTWKLSGNITKKERDVIASWLFHVRDAMMKL